MNAYLTQDRIEAQNWTRHYQQIDREERETELADELEKAIRQHHLESLLVDKFSSILGGKGAITRAFDDDVDFQEKTAEYFRYMEEVIARHQIEIEEDDYNETRCL